MGDLHQLKQKIDIGPTRIFTADGDVKIMLLGKTEGHLELLADPVAILAQFVLNMDIGHTEGDVNGLYAARQGSLQVGDQRPIPGDEPGLEVHFHQGSHRRLLVQAHGGNAALQLMHPHLVEGAGDGLFFLQGEDHPGGLFAVAQGGIVNDDARQLIFVHDSPQSTR